MKLSSKSIMSGDVTGSQPHPDDQTGPSTWQNEHARGAGTDDHSKKSSINFDGKIIPC